MSDDGAQWTTTIPNATLLAADDSGRYVVTGTNAGHISLLDAATGRVVEESRIETRLEKPDDDRGLASGQRRLTRIEIASDGTIAAALTTMVTHAGDLHVELFVKPLAADAQDLGIEPDAAIDHWNGPWALDPGGSMLGYVWTAEDEMIPRLHLRKLCAADEVTLECGLDDEVECDAAAIDAARDMFAVAGEREVFLWHRGAVRAWKKPHTAIDLVVLPMRPMRCGP